MSNTQNSKETKEEELIINGILNDDSENSTDIKQMKAEISNSRATSNLSAPPGLNFTSMMYGDQNPTNYLNDPDYYEYYFALKNPRLPKPTYDPKNPFTQQNFRPPPTQTSNEDTKKKTGDSNSVTDDFDKLNLNGNNQEQNSQPIAPKQNIQQTQPPQQQQPPPQQIKIGGNPNVSGLRQQPDIIQSGQTQNKPQIIQPSAQFNLQHPQTMPQQFIRGPNNGQNFQHNMGQQQYQKQYYNNKGQFPNQHQQQQFNMVPNFSNQPLLSDIESAMLQNQLNQPQFKMQAMNQMQMMGNYPQDYNQYNFMYGNMYDNYQYMNQGMYNRMPYNNYAYQGYYNGGYNNKQAPKMNQPREKINLKDLLENLIENCKDQNGSRQIQLQFEQASEEEKDQIFNIIEKKALELMKDVFGNYVIQKLLEKGSEKHKKALFDIIKGNVANLSLHTYGCRVIQKALEELKDTAQMQDDLIDEINSKIMICIQDQNGNHVIQKCFETLSPVKLKFIIKEVIDNIEQLAFHSYGCRVIQRILEFCSPDKVSETRQIYTKLMENLIKLCECQYGNYIMQYILEKGPLNEKEQILKVVKEHFVELSLNKFASNVTEKSILYSDPEFKKGVLKVLLKPCQGTNESGLIRLTKDAYGNYVIQRLYEQSDPQTKQRMWQALKEDIEAVNELSKNNYGKHVLQYLEKCRAENGRLAPIQMQPTIQNTTLYM